MGCFYAGVPFTLPTAEWQEWIEQYHSLSEIPVMESAGYDGGSALSDWPLPPEPVARPVILGDLNWPIGASRPAIFHGLMTKTQLDLVRAEIELTGPYQSLVMSDGNEGHWIIAVGMRMSPPLPLHQISTKEQLYLVTLWDQRAYWYWRAGSLSDATASFTTTDLTSGDAGTAELVAGDNYLHDPETPDADLGLTEGELTTWDNLGGFDLFEGGGSLEAEIVNPSSGDPTQPYSPGVPATEQTILAEATNTTWADLYEAVAKLLGISIYVDPVNSAYGNPTDRWKVDYRPLPVILDSIATACGQKIVVRLDGRVFAVNWETAQVSSRVQASFTRKIAGGTVDITDIHRWVPYSATVVQGVYDTDAGGITSVTQSQHSLTTLAVPGYEGATGLLYTTVTLHRDYPTAANATHRARVAYDWYGWQLAVIDRTLPGILNWIPTGAEDRIIWTYQNGQLLTRILRGAWLELPTGWSAIDAGSSDNDAALTLCGRNPNDSTWLVDRAAHVEMSAGTDPERRTFTYETLAGQGRCACWIEQGRNPDEIPYPYTAFYDADLELWVGSVKLNTCCDDCATLYIELLEEDDDAVDDQPLIKAWLELTEACDLSGTATVYPLKFKRQCGDAALFEGGSTRLCNSDPPYPCENGFLLLIRCDTCRMESIDCLNCQETCGPPILTIPEPATPFTGSYAVYNGPWNLIYGSDCSWSITCGAITVQAVITIDSILDTATLTVTYSGGPGSVSYEIEMAEMLFPCFQTSPGAGTLTVVSGDTADTPNTITWEPLYCTNCPTECCLGLAPDQMLVTLKDPLGPTIYGTATLTKTTPVGEDDILDVIWTGSGSFAVPGCTGAGTVEWELHCLASDGLWIRHRCASGLWSTLILISAVPAECSPLSGGHLGYDLSGSAGDTCAACDPVSLTVAEV